MVSKLHSDGQEYINAAGMAAREILRSFNIPVYVVPRTNWETGFYFDDEIEIYLGGEKVDPPEKYTETQLVEWFKEKIIERLFELNKVEPVETLSPQRKLEMGEATLLT
ncbi:MAG: hypothetical protein F7C32_04020 [Desulfurococcales archaeon]|nr:hypothetical protein [Desulfurococcales archaeon]